MLLSIYGPGAKTQFVGPFRLASYWTNYAYLALLTVVAATSIVAGPSPATWPASAFSYSPSSAARRYGSPWNGKCWAACWRWKAGRPSTRIQRSLAVLAQLLLAGWVSKASLLINGLLDRAAGRLGTH
ncbi:hypothetical protein [Larkinella arboricola]|uniref:hypothetical protein n=1 Tax=Larkinella arboricola TaxID=643671 RepID=UPI0011BADBE6|nr:hypothetical protein [Larkinella arboricola]